MPRVTTISDETLIMCLAAMLQMHGYEGFNHLDLDGEDQPTIDLIKQVVIDYFELDQ